MDKSTRVMGSLVSRQELHQNLKRSASSNNPGASKRQRIAIDGLDLAKKLKESKLAWKDHTTPERPEEPSSLTINFSGILDKYGDEHESLIPPRLDGVPVKVRCSVQIYHPTSECHNGTLTNVHEELVRVSQEGDIRTTWNTVTGHPETEINLPRSFTVPIRELYVPKPPAGKSRETPIDTPSEISDSEDDSDELLDDGEYGLAEKYFCHVSFSTVRMRPWPPLGLDREISRSSAIGKQLRHGYSHKRDLKLVSKTELSPLESLSLRAPLDIKLGPDRQTTQYQLALNAKWGTPEITQPETGKLEKPLNPGLVWKIELGDQASPQAFSESKLSDYSCGICLAKLNSIGALQIHVCASHDQFKFTFTSPTSNDQDYVISVSNTASIIPPTANTQIRSILPVTIHSPVNDNVPSDIVAQVNKAPEVEVGIMRTIFDYDDDISSLSSMATNQPPTPEPPCAQDRSKIEQLSARESSTSASISDPQSMSPLDTTPDAGSESDVPIEPRKRTRALNSRTIDGDDDSSSSSPEEDAIPQIVVPTTAKPLYDIVTKRLLKPGEPLPPSTVSHDWRIRKHTDIINSIPNLTPAEKEFMSRWDPFIFGHKSTSKVFMPSILEEFINVNRRWFDGKQCRREELLKHLINLRMSGRIQEQCLWGCLEMFQNERLYPRKERQTSKLSPIAREERSLLDLWDTYARNSTTNSFEKFVAASRALRTNRSAHISDGESIAMLRLFLAYHGRTARVDLLALDGIFYNSNLPLPTSDAESEYVLFFNGFEKNLKALDKAGDAEQVMSSFLADNSAWFFGDIKRFQWAKKHLQELHWSKKITLKIREQLLACLEAMESVYYSDDEDMQAAAVENDLASEPETGLRDKVEGKETVAPKTLTSTPFPVCPDPLNPPRPREVRAFGECECGGYARPGESVMCSAEVSS